MAKNLAVSERSLGGEMELSLDALCPTQPGRLPWRSKRCQTVTSGRAGLKLVAQALKASSNETGLLPSYLCSSMIQPFNEEGVAVEFYRVHADLTIDVEDLRHRVSSSRPGSVLFVNYFGFPVGEGEAETLRRIRQQCWVIEDCAQAYLARSQGELVGAIGDLGCFSLQQGKHITTGEGGMVVTSNPDWARRAFLFVNKAW